eukprot:CAMPEP_0182422226 /NCGR_PEP_ID=MMETSP1167-20130531/7846_1 /TAXON_ID=2988 /ORGANISM="Mallomonas Sp, Strain CCMP3275" /LENGTH=405 /DNA_ID=CAMNT_0024600079 /DNA_START=125 /DNA_END=1342 /DNA_ORIENTATION=+
MGATLGIMPMRTLVRRIDECVIQDDRDTIVELMVALERRLAIFSATEYGARRFHDSQGVTIILKIMRGLTNDEVVLRIGFGIFEVLRKNREVIMDFIKYGGLELLDRAFKEHAEDDYLRQQLPRVKREILATGADAAMEEIIRETMSLQLCHKCQENVERQFRIEACISDTRLPLSYERVNRILLFMDNYPRRKAIQRVSLDALLYFARNADAVEQVRETNLVPRVSSAIRIFKNDAEIIWRAYLSLALLAAIDAGVAYECTRLGIHEHGVDIFSNFERDQRTQQQTLWLQASVLSWPQSRRIVQTSKKCMEFYKGLLEKREELMKKHAGKGVVVQVQDKFKPYKVIIPMQIRAFIRETKGQLLEVKVQEEVTQFKPAARKEVVNKPIFGTVATEHYTPGEDGLL